MPRVQAEQHCGEPDRARPGGFARLYGFTLIELVIVLSVMMLAAVVAVPSFLQFHRGTQLRTAALRTLALAGEARGLAVSRDAETRLTLDPGAHALRLTVSGLQTEPPAGPRSPLLEAQVPDAQMLEYPLDMQVRLEPEGPTQPSGAEPASLRFLPDGTADPGRLILARDGFAPVVFEINPRTGRLKLLRDPEPSGVAR